MRFACQWQKKSTKVQVWRATTGLRFFFSSFSSTTHFLSFSFLCFYLFPWMCIAHCYFSFFFAVLSFFLTFLSFAWATLFSTGLFVWLLTIFLPVYSAVSSSYYCLILLSIGKMKEDKLKIKFDGRVTSTAEDFQVDVVKKFHVSRDDSLPCKLLP